jgi:hypothetical protein
VLVFLIPTLAVDQRDPNASPPEVFDAGALAPGVPDEEGAACVEGAWIEVK